MKQQITLVAHNIRSLWNVGSFFRSADCFGAEKIILSGYTGIPPRREISKTAIGAEDWIPWEYNEDPLQSIQNLIKDGYTIVGLEITDSSVDISEYKPDGKICLLLGNEVLGLSAEMLQLCDKVVHIPMQGKKESLNVSVAAGIAMHTLQANALF